MNWHERIRVGQSCLDAFRRCGSRCPTSARSPEAAMLQRQDMHKLLNHGPNGSISVVVWNGLLPSRFGVEV